MPPKLFEAEGIKYVVPKLYEQTKSDIISDLRDAVGGVSITIDCWTFHAMESYMKVTAHFEPRFIN